MGQTNISRRKKHWHPVLVLDKEATCQTATWPLQLGPKFLRSDRNPSRAKACRMFHARRSRPEREAAGRLAGNLMDFSLRSDPIADHVNLSWMGVLCQNTNWREDELLLLRDMDHNCNVHELTTNNNLGCPQQCQPLVL